MEPESFWLRYNKPHSLYKEANMTGSWAINMFISGCAIMMAVSIGFYFYKEVIMPGRGDVSDI